MPRLSVFSSEGSEDTTDNTFTSATRQAQVKLLAKRSSSSIGQNKFVAPSTALLNRELLTPTVEKPLYRKQWHQPTMQLHLRVWATSERKDLTNPDAFTYENRCSVLTRRMAVNRSDTRQPTQPRPARLVKLPRLAASPQESLWLENMQLGDFRPLQAPFVCDIIRILVIRIERQCTASTWDPVFQPLKELRSEAQTRALDMIRARHDVQALRSLTQGTPTPMLVATLRAFLDAFPIRPIHMTKRKLIRMIKRPLYDQFLRPNLEIKNRVRELVIPSTRTLVDSLAFFMIHLIHALENATRPSMAKSQLAEIYGPLLIGFTERPIIIDRDVSPSRTEEAALLEVILEVCDADFWNNLGMLKIHDCFHEKRKLEHFDNLTNSTFPFPTIEPNKFPQYNFHRPRMSIARLRMRTVAQLLEDLRKARLGRGHPHGPISTVNPAWIQRVELR